MVYRRYSAYTLQSLPDRYQPFHQPQKCEAVRVAPV